MDDQTLRYIDLSLADDGRYQVTNRRGGVLPIGRGGEDTDFTPVELFLAALAGCGAIDVGLITGKRARAESFDVRAEGHKIRDEHGNRMVGLKLTFDVTFPDGEDGDRAREVLPRALQQTADRLCTVGRTLQLGTTIDYAID